MAPLRTNDIYILLALLDGPLHGYRVGQHIEELSGGQVRLEAGNLHRTVQKLIRLGLVEISDERPDPEHDDPRRRYYAVTAEGRRILAGEASRLKSLVEQLSVRTLIDGGGS